MEVFLAKPSPFPSQCGTTGGLWIVKNDYSNIHSGSNKSINSRNNDSNNNGNDITQGNHTYHENNAFARTEDPGWVFRIVWRGVGRFAGRLLRKKLRMKVP